MAAMLCDVVVRRRCHHRWAHAPAIHAASHFDHGKRVAWGSISISIHARGSPACTVMVLHYKELVRQSGLLPLLQPGDQIMAA